MTNEEKLNFIKTNYKSTKTWESLQGKDKFIFYEKWINELTNVVPINLYKYRECNDNNLSTLRNRKAWFSNPSTWNDPIDVTVQYNLEKDLKNLEDDNYILNFAFQLINKYIESFCGQKKSVSLKNVKEMYTSVFKGDEQFNPGKMIEYLKPITGDKIAHQITLKLQETFALIFTQEFKETINDGFEKFFNLNEIKNQYIMYSLSETYTNNHQWAMYAANGKGFCIGYEIVFKNNREVRLLPKLLPIYYGQRKEFLLTRILDECLEYSIHLVTLEDLIYQEGEALFVSLYTKSQEWIGEQEWRFSIPSEQINSNDIDFDFAKSLYLGENIEKYWKQELIKIAKEQNLKVYQRKLDKVKSNWIYVEINI